MDLAQARRHSVLCEFIRPYQSHEDIGGFDAKAMADRIVELEAAVERVRALHEPIAKDIPKCVECKNYAGYHVDHPCPTLRALEGTP